MRCLALSASELSSELSAEPESCLARSCCGVLGGERGLARAASWFWAAHLRRCHLPVQVRLELADLPIELRNFLLRLEPAERFPA